MRKLIFVFYLMLPLWLACTGSNAGGKAFLGHLCYQFLFLSSTAGREKFTCVYVRQLHLKLHQAYTKHFTSYSVYLMIVLSLEILLWLLNRKGIRCAEGLTNVIWAQWVKKRTGFQAQVCLALKPVLLCIIINAMWAPLQICCHDLMSKVNPTMSTSRVRGLCEVLSQVSLHQDSSH